MPVENQDQNIGDLRCQVGEPALDDVFGSHCHCIVPEDGRVAEDVVLVAPLPTSDETVKLLDDTASTKG